MLLESQWIVGFVDGEGCFHVDISVDKESALGCQILPEFTVVQSKQDVQILHALKAHFRCGVVRESQGDRIAYRVRNLKHLLEIIVPFFEKHKLKTKRGIDFQNLRRVLLKMSKGEHLTLDGIESIRAIKEKMNRMQTKVESDSSGNS